MNLKNDLKNDAKNDFKIDAPCPVRAFLEKVGGPDDFRSPIGSTKSNRNVSNLFIASFLSCDWSSSVRTVEK